MSKDFDGKSIIVVLVLFAIVLFSEYLSNQFFKFDWLTNAKSVLIMFMGVLVYLSISGYVTNRKLLQGIESELDEFKETLRLELGNVAGTVEKSSIKWLLDQNQINNIEKKATRDMEIWVITPDLKNDTEQENPLIRKIIRIVKQNLARGVRYTYIVPEKDPLVTAKIEKLKDIFKEYVRTGAIEIKRIDKDNFSLLGNMCFVIFNPRSIGGCSSQVYMELPREDRKWWIELSRNQASTIEGKILEILKSAPGAQWSI